MTLSLHQVSRYLNRYIAEYRTEFARLTGDPPQGAGYPALEISPYVRPGRLDCFVTDDGVIVLDTSRQPQYSWWIAGGPALMVDYAQTRTPAEVVNLLEQQGLLGKHIGIYRIVAQHGVPTEIWNGQLEATELTIVQVGDTQLSLMRLTYTLREAVQRLTFGAFCLVLDIKLPEPESDFWHPHIVRRLGFLTADRENRRFVDYMEILPHADPAAWDTRSVHARVHLDVRRDFGMAFADPGSGAILSLGEGQARRYHDQAATVAALPIFEARRDEKLSKLASCIDELAGLLKERPDADERVFHAFLADNAILLDVYAYPISKPRFRYPAGQSPLGKEYVEPDFILKYPGQMYKLVELERPDHAIATNSGQPRAAVTHAYFQIAEWLDYIAHHYDLIKDAYPGISTHPRGMVVLGRSSAVSETRARSDRQKFLLRQQHQNIEFFTYDDLLERARRVLIAMSA